MGVLQTFATFDEFVSLLRVKFFKTLPKIPASDADLFYSYYLLTGTSRSFAVVIQELPFELRDPICVFYLVLRALDTVEDDMGFDIKKKLHLLNTFYEKLDDPTFVIEDCGEKEKPFDIELCRNFNRVLAIFARLRVEYREIIKDITKRMGQGMAEFIDKEVITIEDYNLYCHYVAGLVGIGLTKSFIAYGESKALMGASGNDDHLSNQMGLFLQKTNIIRDYHEDVILEKQKNRDLRVFWPEQVWKLYANKIEDFGQDIPSGVKCLNHLITDALGLVPDVLKYLSMLKDQQVFNFCAIPQVMAIATLTEIYNNENVFKRTVKIRKGMTCSLMLNCKNITQVKQTFRHFANVLEKKVEKSNSTEEVRVKTREAIKTIKGLTQDVAVPTRAVGVSSVVITALAVTLGYVFRNDIRRLFNK